MNPTIIQHAAQAIADARNVAILTGAGVSKESGVPTFRDAMEGLWAQYDPAQLATPQAFAQNPALVWQWYQWRRDRVAEAQPNPAHFALAQLQQLKPHTTLITQNVDDLHERAGSTDVIHLHGNIAANKCSRDCQGDPTPITDLPATDDDLPPPCPHCDAYARPDIVWFGEMLPPAAIQRAYDASENCDAMLVIGTSGLVTPAATLPLLATQSGATLIEVNPTASTLTAHVDYWLQAPAGEAMPILIQALQTKLGQHDA